MRSLRRSVTAISAAALQVSSCSSWMKTSADVENDQKRKHELNMAKQLCSPEALVGTANGFKVAFNGKRRQLDEARGNISVERFKKLSQELQGYNVQWEMVNQQVKIACNQNAICLARNSNSGSCYDSDAHYQEKVKAANDLITAVMEVKVQS